MRAVSCPRSILIAILFDKLRKKQVQYCQLHRYKAFPDDATNDLDLFVEEASAHIMEECIIRSAETCQWYLISVVKRFNKAIYVLCSANNEGAQTPLEIDIAIRLLGWKGIKLIRSNDIIADAREYKLGQKIPRGGKEAAILLAKEFFHKGCISDKFRSRIQSFASDDPEDFLRALEATLGKHMGRFFLGCVQAGDWKRLEKNIGYARRSLILRALMRRPIGQLIDWARFLWGHFSDKVLHPSGLFVCLIGPDGSGKTTIARGLKRDMTDVFSKVRYFHGHLGIIPPLKKYYNLVARLLGKPEKKVTSDDVMQNVDMLPFNPLRAIVYVLYYSVDYFLGHITIRRAKGHGQLVLFDRYFYDYFIQQVHSRAPRWLLRSILRLIPKPDIIIWLRNEPEVIHRRKPELTPFEVRQQNQVCMELIGRYANAFSVQTDNDSEVTLHHVREIIFRFMAQRVKIRERM